MDKKKSKIRKRYGGWCGYCGRKTANTVDHIEAKANGGTNALANLEPACSICNRAKNNYNPKVFKSLLNELENWPQAWPSKEQRKKLATCYPGTVGKFYFQMNEKEREMFRQKIVSEKSHRLTDDQKGWLKTVTARIPILFQAIAEGQYKASFIIGHREVNGKACRLCLVAEVVEDYSQ